jgi:methionyl-tRNA formyltransferase
LSQQWDQGDILTQKEFKLSEGENLETLSAKVKLAAKDLAIGTIEKLAYYWDHAEPQGIGSKWDMPNWDTDRTISWRMSVEEIDRMSRAFGKMDVGASFEGRDWIVKGLSVWKEIHNFEPGYVALSEPSLKVIAALDGFVCLRFFEQDPDNV